jgi:type I restriction enzyme S subunit
MVHMSDAFYGRVERGSLKRVKISEKDIQKYSITHNDLLIARRSLNFEGAAKPCLIPVSDKPLVFESSMIRVTTDQSKILPIYLYYYFSNEKAKQAHILKYVTKSTISGINQDNLKQIKVIMPPLSLQEEFAGVVARVESLRGRMGESERQVEGLFESLLAEAFKA